MMKNKKPHVTCPNWVKEIYNEYVEEKKKKKTRKFWGKKIMGINRMV
jgi:hypothetical protein